MGFSLSSPFKDPVEYFAGGGLVGDVTGTSDTLKQYIPGVGDAIAQDKANLANIAEAEKNRQFQKEMSNTAYQRAMSDMKSAGLNPMLAMSQGGASTPSGSTASIASSSKTALVDKALGAVTGIGSLQNQTTGIQQQQSMNESAIKLNASSAAKNLADAEKTNIDNVRARKYEPLNSAAGRFTDKIGRGMNAVMDLLENTAKEKTKGWDPATAKIKRLGPTSGKESSVLDNFKRSFMKPKG